MSVHRKFAVAFWEGDLAAELAADADSDGFTVCTYLITNKHNHWGLGLYKLPLAYICDATGIALQTVRRCVDDASRRRFAHYHNATKTVWVVRQAKHEWAKKDGTCLSPSSNGAKALIADLPEVFHQLRKSPLTVDFMETYGEFLAPMFDACATDPRRVVNAFKTRSECITDSGVQDAGCRMQDSGCRTQDTACSDPVPGDGSEPQQEEIAYGDQAARAEPPGEEAAGDDGVDKEPADCGVAKESRSADLHEKLLRICGKAQFGGDELRLLAEQIGSEQPEMELLWAAKILGRKLKEMRSPIRYLSRGPWEAMAGFQRFRDTWPSDQPFGEPKAAKAWYYCAEARAESAAKVAGAGSNGDRPDPVLGGLCRWKSSERWRSGFVVSPAQWLEDNSWNDAAPPPRKKNGGQRDVESAVYKEWKPPEGERTQ